MMNRISASRAIDESVYPATDLPAWKVATGGIIPKAGVNAVGIVCPACGDFRHCVIDTRPIAGIQRRRRICQSGHRFTTLEMIADDADTRLAWVDLLSTLTPEAQHIIRDLAKHLKPAER